MHTVPKNYWQTIDLSGRIKNLSKVISLEKTDNSKNTEELKKACSEFETLFISYLLKSMRGTIPKSGFIDGGKSEEFFTSLLDREIAKNASLNKGIGLSSLILRQLNKVKKKPGPEISKIYQEPLIPLTPAQIHSKQKTEDFQLPLKGRISSPYGMRSDPFTGRPRFHQGIDIAGPEGTEIRAARSGMVVFSGKKSGYGNTIIIKHSNEFSTLYGHNAKNLVKNGEWVEQLQPISLVGKTGRATGPHLHFELRRNGEPVNPSLAMA